jgi:hypothetical protein
MANAVGLWREDGEGKRDQLPPQAGSGRDNIDREQRRDPRFAKARVWTALESAESYWGSMTAASHLDRPPTRSQSQVGQAGTDGAETGFPWSRQSVTSGVLSFPRESPGCSPGRSAKSTRQPITDSYRQLATRASQIVCALSVFFLVNKRQDCRRHRLGRSTGYSHNGHRRKASDRRSGRSK